MRFLQEDHPFRHVWEQCESPIEQILCTAMFVDLGMTAVPDGYRLRDFLSDQPYAFLFSQYRIAGYRVDFLIIVADRETCIPFAIECDGKDYHSSDHQRQRDEERDDALRQAGIREVYRFTGWQIVKRLSSVITRIADTLRQYGVQPTPPNEFADYRAFRDQFSKSRDKPELRELEHQRNLVENEEELAAIRRQDATWL